MINNTYVERYHEALDDSELQRESKEGYFATFKMFVRWCSRNEQCDLERIDRLDSREFAFREPEGQGRKRLEKKKLLWSRKEFEHALSLPEPMRCYCLLMLNCGFRHVDISHLQVSDVDWVQGRIIVQRQKLNQLETAPVISYKLWDDTVASLRVAQSDDAKYFFRSTTGGFVENSIKLWWKRYASRYQLDGKRLDMLRKTGSTYIARFDQGLDEFYLGEALGTTAKIHYSFNDGEPNQALDRALQYLGHSFGLAPQPIKTVRLTPELEAALKKLGHRIEEKGILYDNFLSR